MVKDVSVIPIIPLLMNSCPQRKNDPSAVFAVLIIQCGYRESNPNLVLGKDAFYH